MSDGLLLMSEDLPPELARALSAAAQPDAVSLSSPHRVKCGIVKVKRERSGLLSLKISVARSEAPVVAQEITASGDAGLIFDDGFVKIEVKEAVVCVSVDGSIIRITTSPT